MRQISTQSSKCFRKIVTFVLAFAMIVTSLAVSSTESQAAAKVKKVVIGAKVGSSGMLVLKKGQTKKLGASVSPKSASKKLTYKSSNKSVVSVTSKGVVKACKSKGSAKITVTSAQNKKKKATITVKIGTPVKSVAIQTNVKRTWGGESWKLVEKNGQLQKEYASYSATEKIVKKKVSIARRSNAVFKMSVSPKNATQKKCFWKSSKTSIASIVGSNTGTSCKITTRKEGKTVLSATALDGSGKTAKVTIEVTKYVSDVTPAPTPTPDPRIVTVVEDFEKYEPGTTWTRFTAGGYTDSGSMTVVQDPENPANKCLKVSYNGTQQAYDYAPVFSFDISQLVDSKGVPTAGKKLGSYSGVRLNARIVSNDPSAANYKQIFCYFDQAGNIKPEDYFATSNNDSTTAHVADPKLRFGVNISMAVGDDTSNGAVLWNQATTKESNKYFPFAYDSVWKAENASTHFITDSCTTGFKDKEGEPNVGFATRSLTFNTDRIKEADETLLSQEKLDMVIGSTYEGGQTFITNGITVTLYLDNIALIEDDIPLQSIDVTPASVELTPGASTTLSVTYTPANTTHQDMVYTSSDETVAKVDNAGKITAIAAGDAVITASPKDNPALAKSIPVKVIMVGDQTEDLDVLKTATLVPQAKEGEDLAVASETEAKMLDDGSLEISYNDLNQSIFLDLGREYDLRGYKGVEITGKVPGQMSLELYDGSLDKRDAAKESRPGQKEWYETYAGFAYPFFNGSCAWRFEDGGFHRKKAIAEGLVASNGRTPLSSDETLRFSWNDLTGTKGTGDYSKIRYICLKTNKPPAAQEGKQWEDPDKYIIKSLKFLASQVNGEILGYKHNAAVKVNQANAETAPVEYTDDGAKFGKEDTVAAWYLDILDGEVKKVENRNSSFDMDEFNYVKVTVGADVTKLDVKLAAEGQKYEDAVLVGSDEGSGARTIYFSLEKLKKDGKLSGLDTIQVCAHGGTVKLVTAITATPMIEKSDTDPKYILNSDGTKRVLTDEDKLPD